MPSRIAMSNPSFELILILCTLACLAAQAEPLSAQGPQPASGIEGSISLHNISGGPVRQGVPDSRPLSDMSFVVKKGDLTVASFTTDSQGHFRVSLPPGHYQVIRKDWKSRVGFYGPFEMDISQGEMKKVEWKCDTGLQ
jgi:hypothetical protein